MQLHSTFLKPANTSASSSTPCITDRSPYSPVGYQSSNSSFNSCQCRPSRAHLHGGVSSEMCAAKSKAMKYSDCFASSIPARTIVHAAGSITTASSPQSPAMLNLIFPAFAATTKIQLSSSSEKKQFPQDFVGNRFSYLPFVSENNPLEPCGHAHFSFPKKRKTHIAHLHLEYLNARHFKIRAWRPKFFAIRAIFDIEKAA